MDETTFDDIKRKVAQYLDNSRNADPSDEVIAYFNNIPHGRRIKEAANLLNLIKAGMAKTKEVNPFSGNIGVIVLGLHYAYPLLLTLLSYWVNAVYKNTMSIETGEGYHVGLYMELYEGINKWDEKGMSKGYYNHLMDPLIPHEQPETVKKPGRFGRLLALFGL